MAAAETFWKLRSSSVHIWPCSAKRHLLGVPQSGKSLTCPTGALLSQAGFAEQNDHAPSLRSSGRCNNLPLSGFINDEMLHSVFLSGKCVKSAQVPGKGCAFNYLLVIKASFKSSWAIKQSESSVYHHRLLSRQSWCQRDPVRRCCYQSARMSKPHSLRGKGGMTKRKFL